MLRMLIDFSGDDAVFGHFGATGGYALAARRAMHEFGTGPETWKKSPSASANGPPSTRPPCCTTSP